MPLTRFEIEPIADVRGRVGAATQGAGDGPDGWSVSDVDPMAVLDLFSALRLRSGFELVAYRFRESGNGNGNGVVWAVSAGTEAMAVGCGSQGAEAADCASRELVASKQSLMAVSNTAVSIGMET